MESMLEANEQVLMFSDTQQSFDERLRAQEDRIGFFFTGPSSSIPVWKEKLEELEQKMQLQGMKRDEPMWVSKHMGTMY